nr:hypothetical protein [Tanacetum cinerariifolium]
KETIICLATNQKFNFSRYILLSLVKNIKAGVPFFMFPRFVQLLIDHQLGDISHHKEIYNNPSLTKKVFANMKRVGTGFSRVVTSLFGNMLVPTAKEVVNTAVPVVKKEKSFKQGRIIADIDEDVKINLEEAQTKLYRIDLEHPEKVLITTAGATTTAEATKTMAKVKTINDEVRIQALTDEKRANIKESSIRHTLKLDDAEGTSCFANAEIFDGLAKIVPKQPLRMNLEALWHPQSFVLLQIRSSTSQEIYDNPSLTKKVFANMKRVGTGFSRVVTSLFGNMLVPTAKEEKSFKQGRIIADIDEDVKINLEEAWTKLYRIDLEHPEKVLSMQDVDDEEPAEKKC